jgi:cytochrome c-type biogenesis protein CcmE
VKRGRWIVAGVVCIGAIVFMITQLGANLDFYRTVSDAVAEREEQGTKEFRIGGVVKPKTLEQEGSVTTFELTDGDATVSVVLAGTPHELVAKNPDGCVPVVVRGRWDGERFDGSELIVRHGSEYDDEDHPLGDERDQLSCTVEVPESQSSES